MRELHEENPSIPDDGVHAAIGVILPLVCEQPSDLEQVLSIISTAISAMPATPHATLETRTSTSSGGTTSNQQLASLYSCRAAVLCRMGRYRDALWEAAQAIAHHDTALYHWPMGRALVGISLWREATWEFTIALTSQDKKVLSKILLDRANAYRNIGKGKEAIADYLRVLQEADQKDSRKRTTVDCRDGAIAETALQSLGVPIVPFYAREKQHTNPG